MCAFIFAAPLPAQKVAIIAPDKTRPTTELAQDLESGLSKSLAVLDNSLAGAAFNSAAFENPFNLTSEDAKKIGAAIGCEFFILVRSGASRRSAFGRSEYYESHAAVFGVSSRTGRLVYFKLLKFDAAKPKDAETRLRRSVNTLAREIADRLKAAAGTELAEPPRSVMETVPDPNSPLVKTFIAPVPFRRIKPEYTATAAYFEVKATVEIEVDLDAKGSILRTEIVRWAGYGLDEAVEAAVRKMNWRPAESNHKPLPMRFLVRYNFTKIEKE